MAFTDPFIRRPVLATVVSLLIVLLGFQAWSKLPLRQYPQMENALITVTTAYPGANAETILSPSSLATNSAPSGRNSARPRSAHAAARSNTARSTCRPKT